MNEPSDVQWLKETHLRGLSYPEFASFVLYGNEDSPTRVELYAASYPTVSDVPVSLSLA
jgi:hypothetical protein